MGGGRVRIFAASVMFAAFVPVLRPAQAAADPPLVYPGMEIHQDVHVCTLGYVDMAARIAYTAGHCRGGGGVVTDRDRNVVGQMATFRDDTPSGSTVATDQPISDYETIVLNPAVAVSNILPGGRRLDARPVGLTPGQPICHFGVVTQETCGTVEGVNNGWFTMSHGVTSQKGDSGGPVYLTPSDGTAQLVGIFNSVWGDFPAAVSWQTTSAMAHSDMR